MGKSSVVDIARDHFLTLRDNRKREFALNAGDMFEQIALPVLFGLFTWWRGWSLGDATGAIAGISIVAALMCAMAVFIFQIRQQIHHDDRLNDDDFVLVDEVFSNVMWAILVGLFLALYLVVCSAAGLLEDTATGHIMTAVAVAFGFHFVFVVGMCLKRLRRAYQRIAARTE